MNDMEKAQVIKAVKEGLRDMTESRASCSDDEIYEFIQGLVFDISKSHYISHSDKHEIIRYCFNSMRKLDILQPLLEDNEVTEIMINGHKNIFVEKKGKQYRYNLSFVDERKLEDVIQNIVGSVNRIVNESTPITDARLKDGSRVNVVLPPISLDGPIVTIRRFPDKPISMEDLVKWQSISEEAAELLDRMVKAKLNIFICGGTGSGKTTLLNVLSNCIPKDERVITIEDSAELQIGNIDNLVRLETKNANTEAKGEVKIRDLIRASLRMRPDRIIVGEVRGEEALDMLQAMNTGHDGSISTGHSNSARDMLTRLETMVLCAAQLPLEAIRQQIASAIDVFIYISRLRDRSRRVMEISEVKGIKAGVIELNPLFSFVEEDGAANQEILGRLKRTQYKIENTQKFHLSGVRVCEEY